MRTAARIAVATAVVATGCLSGPTGPAAASADGTADGAAGVQGAVTVVNGTVVTTAHVPTSSDPVQVARSYTYRLEAACWSSGTVTRPTRARTVATARVPSGPGAFQLRVPPDHRTSFSFADPVTMLAQLAHGGAGLRCPGRSTSAPYRLTVETWEVTVTHFDGSSDRARGEADATYHFAAPAEAARREKR